MNKRNGTGGPRIIPVGEELPPMDDGPPPKESHHNGRKGKPADVKAKVGERFGVLNAFVDVALADLTRAEIVVWLILYRDTRDGVVQISWDGLANRGGLNRRHVGRAIASLKDRGLIKLVRRGGVQRGSSRYRVQGLPREVK
jgi:hypothetical protein